MNLTAKNISAVEAEEMKSLPNNTVLISINASNGELFPLKLDRNSSRVLTVRFDDVTDDKDVHGCIYKKIDGDAVLKILDFINLNQDKNFIVHCAQGISRSAAICLYLHIIHGHVLKEKFWSHSRPNAYVLGMLMKIKFMK